MLLKSMTVEHLTFAQYCLSDLILFFLVKMMLFLLLKNKQSFVIPYHVLFMLSCLFLCGTIRIRKRYENSLFLL